jgi:hypothetical protein
MWPKLTAASLNSCASAMDFIFNQMRDVFGFGIRLDAGDGRAMVSERIPAGI